jgi:hypothetical protein
MTSIQKFIYTNCTDGAVRITVEPWAEQFVIQAEQQVEITVNDANPDEAIEIEQLSDGLTIHGYEGCVITLTSDGIELEQASQE